MANTPQRSASINELAVAVINQDTQLQSRIRDIVRGAVDQAERTLRHGTDADKNALMKTLMPHMLEAMRQTDASERQKNEHDAYQRMLGQLRGDLGMDLPPIAN